MHQALCKLNLLLITSFDLNILIRKTDIGLGSQNHPDASPYSRLKKIVRHYIDLGELTF